MPTPSKSNPIYFLTHHKCATTWLISYLRTVAQLNSLRFAPMHRSDRLPMRPLDIVVLTNAHYGFLSADIAGGVHVIRNPFSVLSSAYHSHLRTHAEESWPQLQLQRRVLQSVPMDVGIMLTLAFIERMDFAPGAIGPFTGMRTWDYGDPRFRTLRMEDLVVNVSDTVGAALRDRFGAGLQLPDADQFQFKTFAQGRVAGTVDDTSHYRSGDPDQWRRELPAAAVAYVRAHFVELIDALYPEAASG